MPTLHLVCLGAFSAILDGHAPLTLRTDKVRGLLVYLALEPRPHRREALAGTFWPEHTDDAALTNLRTSLYRLRQPLEEAASGIGDALFNFNRQTVALNPGSFTTDVQRFEDLINAYKTHAHHDLAGCDVCLAHLSQAVALYQNDLLAGFISSGAPAFEEWLVLRREGLRQKMQGALYDLAIAHESGAGDEAQQYARRLLAMDPWREDAHRLLMRILAGSGQTGSALAQYQLCRQMLAAELGIEPDPETTALYEQIRTGNFRFSISDLRLNVPAQPIENLKPVLSEVEGSKTQNRQDWGEMPAVEVFHGRSAEMAQVQRWLVQEQCRLVSILGIGGMGKTTLAAAATKVAAAAFDAVIWRSLLNAPPLDEIVRNWLQILSQHTLVNLPESLDERLRLLLGYLHEQRCLLVLDNVESILQPSQTQQQRAGEMRAGYEGYAQLFEWLAKSDHRSCLLLTSREQPYALARFGLETRTVRHLSLSGLDLQAGSAILQGGGLSVPIQDAALLVKSYSGNPLALQLVASNIADFFGGNVAAFQREEHVLFDGIRTVLDQQFERLSELEREILIWLAIEREAITVQTLRQNFVQAVTTSVLLRALNSLQARSLLEKVGDGLTLQNVVIEYFTDRLVSTICAEISKQVQHEHLTTTPTSAFYASLWLHRFALLKAQSKEYVRLSQARLILQMLAEQLVAKFGKSGLVEKLKQMIASLRQASSAHGYAGGNLLNLLLHLRVDVTGYDFSQLSVWQAYLCGESAHAVNFASADLTGSNFTNPFSAVWAVDYSPDGQLIAGGSLDGSIYLWRIASGETVGVYTGHHALVYAVAFSPNGRLLASTSEDSTIRLWRTEDGQLLHVLRDHASTAYSIAFSPDGNLLASGSDNHQVHVWNVHTGEVMQTLAGHSSRVVKVAFSADGAYLASCSPDQTVRLWDVATGEPVRTLQGHQHRIEAIAFNPQPATGRATFASGGADNAIRLWDAQTGENIRTLYGHEDFITTLAFSSDGATLASGAGDQTVRLWDVQTGEALLIMQALGGRIWSVVISPDGKSLASGSWDQAVRIWDVQTGQPIRQFNGYSFSAPTLAFEASGAVLVGTIDGDQVRVWEAQTGRNRHTLIGHTQPIRVIALSQDGNTLVSAGLDQTVRTWGMQDGKLRQRFEGHTGRIESVAVSPDGRFAASSGLDQTVRVWDSHPDVDGKIQRIFPSPEATLWSLALSSDHRLLAGGGEAQICVWNLVTNQVVYRLPGHKPICQAMIFSPDSSLLASGGQDQIVYLWEMATGQLRHTLRGHQGTIEALAFSSDGRRLTSAGADHRLCMWDVQHGTLTHQLVGHTSWPLAVAFQPGDRLIASGSSDGALKFWDVQSGVCLQTMYANGPYSGMNVTGVTGISEAQKTSLRALGAIEA